MGTAIYTTEIHVKRLKQLLKTNKPCNHCPAGPRLSANRGFARMWKNWDEVCIVCWKFIVPKGFTEYAHFFCPCFKFGADKALEITKNRIKKYEEE